MRSFLIAAIAATALATTPASAAKPPDTWEGLYKVPAKRGAIVYLLPGADFRPYSKVLIDKPEVAFNKNWQRNLRGLDRLNDREIQRVRETASRLLTEQLAKAFVKQGYQVVTEPGADVLLIRTALANLMFVVPQQSARSFTVSEDAGEAALVLEVRDSVAGSLLGRALDEEVAGGGMPVIRNEATLQSDFEYLFADWARQIANGMGRLKDSSPIDANGRRVQ